MFKPLTLFVLFVCAYVITQAQPANDLCSSATVLNVGTSCGATAATLAGATATGSPFSPRGTTNDVWFRLNVTSNTKYLTISIPSRGSSLTNANSFVEVFNTSNCGGLTIGNMIASNNTQNTSTIIIANAAAGTNLLIRVFTTGNTSSGTWTFSICANSSGGTAPGNNECSNATALTPNATATGTIAYATASTGIPAACSNSGTPDDDVWFRFTATATTSTINVSNASLLGQMGAMIQLFSGSCGALTSIGCGRESFTATNLEVGTQYFIRVYSFAGMTNEKATAAPVNANTFHIGITAGSASNVVAGRMNEVFRLTNLSTSQVLADPWEITYGTDNHLWLTEARGYKVFRVNPQTGARTTVADLWQGSDFGAGSSDSNFRAGFNYNFSPWPQGGFAGLALHPNFTGSAGGQNFVYVSYVYRYDGGSSPTGIFFTNRLVRFTYNPVTQRLESPVSLCDTLPGSNDHNSQRMIAAREDGQFYLYYASGDVGSGQFNNRLRTMRPQVTGSYEGKILRFNLEPDGDAGAYDRWIPNNNPFNIVLGQQSAVWATGIRNNQGFAFDPVRNILYGSSHGPYSDDEINILEAGKNYGHPLVVGYSWDNNYSGGITAGSRLNEAGGVSTAPPINNETTTAASIPNYQDPIFSAYPENATRITNIWNGAEGNGSWPSEGWSGLDLYTHTLIPGWKQSLVSASLKWGRLVRNKLNAAGTAVIPIGATDTASYFGSTNRFRDLAFHPNGREIFVIMDRSATTSGPSAGDPIVPACGGCLQRYTFLGYNHNGTTSTIPASIPIDNGTANSCAEGTTVTINAANNNNNLWVPITGPDGNIVAEINANGNNLGTVTSSFFVRNGAARTNNGRPYMNRNITLTPQQQPTTPVSVRLYFTGGELSNLQAADPAVGSVNDLTIVKTDQNCSSIYNGVNAAPQVITGRYTQGSFGHALQATISSFSSFYFANANATLPFRLLSFTGTARGDDARLQWVVTDEEGVQAYELERSTDNRNFGTVASLDSRNGGNNRITYSYTDVAAALHGNTLYYRLKVQNKEGNYQYSSVVRVSFAALPVTLNLFPNPADVATTLRIQAPVDEVATLRIIDNTGRVVLNRSITLVKGMNQHQLEIGSLQPGLYYIDITSKSFSQKTKLIKR